MINYLRTKGRVYLVRLPTSKELIAIENKKYPHFNTLIRDMARKQNVQFFDFSANYAEYDYTDGNHLYKESGKSFLRV